MGNGWKRKGRIVESLAGRVRGYLRGEASKGPRNSSTEQGEEEKGSYYCALKHHASEMFPARSDSTHGL